MSVNILLGLQWGDEGKGKIVDVLAPQYDVVARFQGGPNAGHTLEFDGIKHILRQIPSGIFRPYIKNIIGNGVVLDPVVLQEEVEKLKPFQIDVRKNLFISKKTHLILPTHKMLDIAQENAKGDKKIGSTLRGISPAYQDKIGRQGIRVGDILSPHFKQKYLDLVERHKAILDFLHYDYALESVENEFFESIEFLKSMNLIDGEYLLNDALKQRKTILAEGAQGSLLDIDFGSYPFVTSSNTVATGACAGLGIAPCHIREVFGIFKAYCTRVGSGPFPTEQDNVTGELIRETGKEYGAVTGRKRRCGWLDLPALKYSAMINGTTQLLMMKVDVLNDFDEIQICTHYELENGEVTDQMPFDISEGFIKPIYKSFKGWKCNLAGITDFNALPPELMQYIQFIENEMQLPITLVSIGPDRTQTILKN